MCREGLGRGKVEEKGGGCLQVTFCSYSVWNYKC